MKATKNKLIIVGTGHVGSAVLNCALSLNLISEIVTIDKIKEKAAGEALDSTHTTPFTYSPNVKIHSGGYEQCSDAKVIIIAAGPSIMPDEKSDRTVLAERNVEVMKDVMSSITKYTKDAVIIIITNPLDTMVYYAENYFGYPKNKIFGTGTSLDSSRFRRIIANKYNVDPKNVHGYMLGEHGNSAFPTWSLLNIGGVPCNRLDEYFKPEEPLDREKIASKVVDVAYDVLHLKGFTSAGIAMAACRLAKAVLMDEHSIMPVSTTLEGEYGLNDVALSLPCIITENGVEKRIEVPLLEDEIAKLKASAENILKTMRAAKLVK
ncbi:MAG: L-lactate dehydrogenase [Clostridium luticellarii]|jgi:L-lactate dehydrogenase|uniref:L-lactate dehydrogenase n=1 Tax=Clostridium luticellarii TaxID=1691940 RepID=A0A2T0BM34_9CLOT|nr:L-lactate dehydrogenase [Clostridium luticellarii]MCI1996046.1 L-lactate dehydrogenase [Clostridium luticellarii]MCI2040685.1 L-lactate dehydrogenase [Clostridium luticellarii]PRR84945.1 L-lactate dehydrogenase [Clostridium luticellarii]